MNPISRENRKESYVLRPWYRKNIILNTLGDRKLTAREIAYELGYQELNMVRPRLTELCEEGKVDVVGKVVDETTDRRVSIYMVKK